MPAHKPKLNVTIKQEEQTTTKEDKQAEVIEIEDETATRRPRKKLRRPVISDTIPAIPVAAFQRMVREVTQDRNPDIRWAWAAGSAKDSTGNAGNPGARRGRIVTCFFGGRSAV